MNKSIAILTLSLTFAFQLNAQKLCLTVAEAESQGVSISVLDETYKSAVHVDTTLAVFKTESEQKELYQAYSQMLHDLASFLENNSFQWDQPRRCFNRIYFTPEGTIDYFIFQFIGEPEDQPTKKKQEHFQKLVNSLIQDYQFGATADIQFAQCSPTVYKP